MLLKNPDKVSQEVKIFHVYLKYNKVVRVHVQFTPPPPFELQQNKKLGECKQTHFLELVHRSYSDKAVLQRSKRKRSVLNDITQLQRLGYAQR